MRKHEQHSDKELINLVLTLITDHSTFTNNWLELIFNQELNIPPEIKNRIFTIWFCGTLDTINQEEQSYLHLLGECQFRDFKNNISLLEQFGNLVESIKIKVREIDENSQVGIVHFRNTIVHGRIHSVHNDRIKFQYFDRSTNRIRKTDLSKSEFWEIINSVWAGNVDNFLEGLRTKFFEPNSHYYNNLKLFSQSDFFQTASHIAYKDLNELAK